MHQILLPMRKIFILLILMMSLAAVSSWADSNSSPHGTEENTAAKRSIRQYIPPVLSVASVPITWGVLYAIKASYPFAHIWDGLMVGAGVYGLTSFLVAQ